MLLSQYDNVLAQSTKLDSFNTPATPIRSDSPEEPIPSLTEFVESLESTDEERIVGVFAPGLFALRVVQQPLHEDTYVSDLPDVLTQFMLASNFGSYGFLAHDHLVGAAFFNFEIGQHVFLIDGNGIIRPFVITSFRSVEALSPQSPYSQFRSLEFPWSKISVEDLFHQIYAENDRVILQTCISYENLLDWGRFFVIAVPNFESYGVGNIKLSP
jgi:hypothetical protein